LFPPKNPIKTIAKGILKQKRKRDKPTEQGRQDWRQECNICKVEESWSNGN
jgi:hypothetical protein